MSRCAASAPAALLPETSPYTRSAAVGDRRRLIGERAALLVLLQHGLGVVLRLLDVRLVERVDAEVRACHRGRELPAEELGGEVVLVDEVERDHRMSGSLQRVDGAIELGVIADAQRHEEAVVGVDGRARRSARRRSG